MPNATPSSLSASAREAAVRRQTISCIVPAYNEAENLPRLVPLVAQALEATGHPFEIIVVNDGSADDTSAVLAGLCEIHAPLRALDLSRNFGKEAALTAGLDAARGDAVILMDADLQHSPDLIGQMLQHWYEGAEVVYAVRRNRQDEGLFKRLGTRLFYGMVNRGARFRIPPDAGDFRLMDRRVVAALRRLPERNRFMKGLYAWAGFRHVALPYTPQERHAGRTHYSKWRLLNLALDGLTAFSTWPLRVVTGTGVLSALLVCCGLSLVNAQYQSRHLLIDLERAQALSRQLDIDWAQLQLDQSTLGKHERIESIARRDLSMTPLTAARTQYLTEGE